MITFDNFILSDTHKKRINMLVNKKKIRILFSGGNETGKTTLLNCISSELLGTYNILRIENYNDSGVSYFRTEVRGFCQMKSTRSKILIIDNIDMLKDNSQSILDKLLSTYKDVNIICTCQSEKKVNVELIYKLYMIKLSILNNEERIRLLGLYNNTYKVMLTQEQSNYIITNENDSNLNMLQTLKYLSCLSCNVNMDILRYHTMDKSYLYDSYFLFMEKNDITAAINSMHDINNTHVSIMDLLIDMLSYVKKSIENDKKFDIIKIIIRYCIFINTIREDDIELYFMTYDIYYEIYSDL
jgi:DNA polymerase III delta prime subunit